MAALTEAKPFRHILRDRILVEMLRATKNAGGSMGAASSWKVLITDSLTLRVISSSCKMPDLTEEGISLVEDLSKRRQPQKTMEVVYFIQPTPLSFNLFKNDMQGKDPLYKRAHVFFSRPLPREFLQVIKEDPLLRPRIAALREMNLEALTVDMQGFVTDNGDALANLFSSEINGREYERTIHDVAARLATVFASLKEFPVVRYKAAKVSSAGAGSPQRMRDMVPSKLAAALWERILKYKTELQGFPQKDTCDLLIVDRTLDPISPVIHDWSYGGMCFDLLPVDGNKYEYETAGADGQREKKAVLLDEHDPIWLEVRHLFLAEAYQKVNQIFQRISSKMTTKEDMTGSEMQELIRNMAMYREHRDKVELHIKISSNLSGKLRQEGLFDVGKLEQGFVFGDKEATYKELSSILKDKEDEMSPYSKLRLLLVYAATHPEKLDRQKLEFWGTLACLGKPEIQAIANLELLGVPLALGGGGQGSGSSAFSLSFGGRKAKSGVQRKERKGADEEAYELSRFYPLIQDVLEDLHSGTLSAQDYPFVQEPSTPTGRSASLSSASSSSSATSSSSSQDQVPQQSLPRSFFGSRTAEPPAPSPSPSPSSSSSSLPSSSGSLGSGSVRSVRKKGAGQPRAEGGNGTARTTAGSSSSAGGATIASWALKSSAKESSGPAPGGDSQGSGAPAASSVRASSVRSGGGSSSLASAAGNLSLSNSKERSGLSSSSIGGNRGRRLIVFVIGGMTRAEIRVAHVLSQKLNREVIIGSTSLDTPLEFIERMKKLKR